MTLGGLTGTALKRCRDYLVTALSLTMWQRAGVLAAVTATGLNEAERCDKTRTYALTVRKHKTSATVSFSKHLRR